MIVPLPLTTSNTVPYPTRHLIGGAEEIAAGVLDHARVGIFPLAPLNEARVVIVPLPVNNLEHRAVPDGCRHCASGAEEIAAGVLDQARVGVCPLVPLKGRGW